MSIVFESATETAFPQGDLREFRVVGREAETNRKFCGLLYLTDELVRDIVDIDPTYYERVLQREYEDYWPAHGLENAIKRARANMHRHWFRYPQKGKRLKRMGIWRGS